jgi:hypothetical protein
MGGVGHTVIRISTSMACPQAMAVAGAVEASHSVALMCLLRLSAVPTVLHGKQMDGALRTGARTSTVMVCLQAMGVAAVAAVNGFLSAQVKLGLVCGSIFLGEK